MSVEQQNQVIMNVTRVFESSCTPNGITINFQGTLEDPRFQANQIGAVLGLANIRDTIKDFDADEKGVGPAYTPGGEQQTLFLTEAGLHHLLFMSRKPIARPFQKWVTTVVMELRSRGRHDLEQDHVLALKNGKAEHTAAIKKERHETLVRAFAHRPLLYLGEVGELPDGVLLIKYGETDNIEKRESCHRKSYGKFSLLDVFPCSEPHMFEQWLSMEREFKTRKYTGLVNGCTGREYLAVAPSDYPKLKQFIKKNLSAHSGWTIEQQLEKARYDAMAHLSSVARDMRAMLTTFSEATPGPSNTMASCDIRHEMVGLVRDLRLLVKRPSFVEVLSKGEDGSRGTSGISSEDDVETEAQAERVNMGAEDGLDAMDVEDGQDAMAGGTKPETASTSLAPKRKLGRPAKPKAPLPSDGAPLSCFLEECCILDPDAKTLCALVRARHRLWRRSNSKEETSALCTFFDAHFLNVKETDVEHLMTSSYYKGLSLKPWVPPVPGPDVFQTDVDAFIRETCEVHVMGRVRTDDLLTCFAAWKGAGYSPTMTYHEKQRVLQHVQASFFRSMVPVTKGAECGPGFFGLYNATATAECREVGYNRSPNTRACVLKLDSKGRIVAVIDSLQVFATSVMSKSSAYACNQMTKCFADGMRGLALSDGHCYMRAYDYHVKKAKEAACLGTST